MVVNRSASIARAIESYSATAGRRFPWRMERASPWGILVAEIMLKMTTASKVVPVWEEFLRRYPSPSGVARSRPEALLDILRPLGLEFQRARSLRELAQALADKHGGEIPTPERELVALPGVGPYTARAFLWTSRIAAAPPVDRNIERVVSRIYRLRDQKPTAVEQSLDPILRVARDGRAVFLGLLDISAKYCRPVSPKCTACPLQRLCETGRRRTPAKALRHQ